MKNDDLTRRRFLATALGGLGVTAFGGLGAFQKLAMAGGPEYGSTRRFIFCYFPGGWDTLLGLDPRDPAIFTEEAKATTLVQPAYDLLDDDGHTIDPAWFGDLYLGPYIGDLGALHGDKLCVVRGMSMETLTHEVGRRRFLTGKAPAGLTARGSSTATWLASLLGQDELIPNLSLRVESYNVDQPNYASGLTVDSVADLLAALQPGDVRLQDLSERQIDLLLSEAAACKKAQGSTLWQEAEDSRLAALDLVESNLGEAFDFRANTPEMEAIRDQYGIANSTAGLSTPEASMAAAAVAITQNLTRVASVAATTGLDTHFDNWTTDQGPGQERGFNAVARLVEDLSSREFGTTGDSWMDHTTIIGFSEFSRTPLINANLGRDHALTNACFLLGAGVRGNVAVGAASDVGYGPQAIDLDTGALDPDGEVPRPEHILRALMHSAGIEEDVADLRVEPLRAILE